MADKIISISNDNQNLITELSDTDCLLVNPFVFKVNKEIIDAAPNLKYIGVLATAFGKIDCEYATTKNIVVCNIPNYSTEAVAEFAIGTILENIRELERAKKQARKEDYSESTFFKTSEIKNKTFGIIGLGNIGSRVAELALAFGADVRYWSKNRKNELEAKGIKYQEVKEILSECDLISLHLAYTKETELFLNETRISKIKTKAILVNLAPNELIDLNALQNRLANEDIVYIMDHSDELTPEQAKQLSKYKNCIIYPPIGYTTKEATIAKQDIFVNNIINYQKGSPTNKVN